MVIFEFQNSCNQWLNAQNARKSAMFIPYLLALWLRKSRVKSKKNFVIIGAKSR